MTKLTNLLFVNDKIDIKYLEEMELIHMKL